jgi:hypothetical protein
MRIDPSRYEHLTEEEFWRLPEPERRALVKWAATGMLPPGWWERPVIVTVVGYLLLTFGPIGFMFGWWRHLGWLP